MATDEYRAFVDQQPRRKSDVYTHLEQLADQIVDAGVPRDPRWDRRRRLPLRRPSPGRRMVAGYVADGDVGPMSALKVNDGFRTWTPRRTVGRPGRQRGDDPHRPARRPRRAGGCPPAGRAPADATEVAKITSEPLRDIVSAMLTSSDNLTAELFAKELGVRASNQGTTAAGTAAIVAELTELGVPTTGSRSPTGRGSTAGTRSPAAPCSRRSGSVTSPGSRRCGRA